MALSPADKKVYELASIRDPKTGKWLLGRRGIAEKVKDVSEWRIRMIIREVRGEGKGSTQAPTPEQRVIATREAKQLEMPVISVKVNAFTPRKPSTDSIEHWVIGSDFHAPYHHEASCQIFYQIIQELNPSKVILLGDALNLDEFSRYPGEGKYPGAPTWIDEVAIVGQILGNIVQASRNKDMKIEWFEGNHELRLKKHLMRHDPSLYGHLDIPKLFQISDNKTAASLFDGLRYIDVPEIYDPTLGLIVKHGTKVRKHAGMSAQAEVDDLLFSVIMGHCHRLGLYRKSSGRSRYTEEQPLFGMETGCLCRYDLPYVEGSTSNWQHGFGVLTIDHSSKRPLIEPSIIEINDNKALFRGKVYKA